MGLIKLLIFLALAYLAFSFWRRLKAAQADKQRQPPPPQAPAMVRCAQCQLHLPQSLALRLNDKWYCCSEHRDVDQQH